MLANIIAKKIKYVKINYVLFYSNNFNIMFEFTNLFCLKYIIIIYIYKNLWAEKQNLQNILLKKLQEKFMQQK